MTANTPKNYWSVKFTVQRTTDAGIITTADVIIESDTMPDVSRLPVDLGIHEAGRVRVCHEAPVKINLVEETAFVEEPTLTYDNMKVWRIPVQEQGHCVPSEQKLQFFGILVPVEGRSPHSYLTESEVQVVGEILKSRTSRWMRRRVAPLLDRRFVAPRITLDVVPEE